MDKTIIVTVPPYHPVSVTRLGGRRGHTPFCGRFQGVQGLPLRLPVLWGRIRSPLYLLALGLQGGGRHFGPARYPGISVDLYIRF